MFSAIVDCLLVIEGVVCSPCLLFECSATDVIYFEFEIKKLGELISQIYTGQSTCQSNFQAPAGNT